MIRRGEATLTAAVAKAMGRWLSAAKRAIAGRPSALPVAALTADTGDATESTGAASSNLPNMNLWPAESSWQIMIDQVVAPEIQKLFGKAFAAATREADIHAAHYEQAYMATVSDRLSRNLWPDRVFEEVREVVADGIAEGKSITNITKEISEVMSVDHQQWEARRIARTETMGAVNGGAWNGAAAYAEITGATMFKQWFATDDSRTRPDHVKAHEQVVPITTDFVVGGYLMAYPGVDGAPAKEVCNCRCTFLTLTEREAAKWISPEAHGPEAGHPQDLMTEAGVSQTNTAAASAGTEAAAGEGAALSAASAFFAPSYQGVDKVPTYAGPRPVIDPTSTPPTVLPPTDQSTGHTSGGGDVGSWWGVLAPLDTPSADGRMIATPDTEDGTPRTRPLPLPLLYQDTLASGHDGAFQVGLICGVLAANGNLYAYGTFDMEDPRAAGIARKVASGNAGWVSVDLDDTTMEIDEAHAEGPMAVASDWRLMSATLVNQPAFPEAKLSTGRPGDAMPELDGMLDDGKVGVQSAGLYDPDAYQICDNRECKPCRAFLFHVYGLCVDDACQTCAVGELHNAAQFAEATCDDPDCEYCGRPYAPAEDATPAELAEAEELGRAGTCGLSPGGCAEDCPDCAGKPYADDKPPARRPHQGATGPARPTGKRHGGRTAGAHAHTTEGSDMRPFSVFSVLHPDTGLPVADPGQAWDGAAAAKRVADYAKGADGKINPAKYGKAFLWRDDNADATNVTAYKLGFADVIDGRLTIVPRAVYAVGGVLSGARGGVNVPDAAMPSLKTAAKRLYGRVASATGNKDLKAPWESSAGKSAKASVIGNRGAVFLSALVASGEFAPPRAWFENPNLDAPTGTTVTDDGRVYGHIATWRTCHTGFKDKCVTAPRSKSGYAYFHLGTVRTAEGDDVAVGTLHYGTDHADTRAPLASAQRHYADTGCAAAVVCVGEDEHGIWFAGAALPNADLVTLRHAPLSGDWRQVGGAMELVGALCVNQPGFPIPRPRYATDDRERVYALCAAGAIAPPACAGCEVCDCGSGCGGNGGTADPAAAGNDDVMGRFIAGLAAGVAAELRAEHHRDARAERYAGALKTFGRVPRPRSAGVVTPARPAARHDSVRPAPASARPSSRLERMGALVASMKKGG